MCKTPLFIIFLSFCLRAVAQYPPAAGQEGSTAIHADSSVFIDWASSCEVDRGYMDISQPESGFVNYGDTYFATEKADNNPVSLGDGGTAILTFNKPIVNGPGPDFAVFENGLSDEFLELALIEVSSNGTDYIRFPSVSLTQTDIQIETFGLLIATKLHNLAGKYRVMYGVPFDFADLENTVNFDEFNVTHIRVVSITGSIDEAYADYDSEGNIINDPWPTLFESGGFDLDAVGVIHNSSNGLDEKGLKTINVYPNPASDFLQINDISSFVHGDYFISDISGNTLMHGQIYNSGNFKINLENLIPGLYFIRIQSNDFTFNQKFVKK